MNISGGLWCHPPLSGEMEEFQGFKGGKTFLVPVKETSWDSQWENTVGPCVDPWYQTPLVCCYHHVTKCDKTQRDKLFGPVRRYIPLTNTCSTKKNAMDK